MLAPPTRSDQRPCENCSSKVWVSLEHLTELQEQDDDISIICKECRHATQIQADAPTDGDAAQGEGE